MSAHSGGFPPTPSLPPLRFPIHRNDVAPLYSPASATALCVHDSRRRREGRVDVHTLRSPAESAKGHHSMIFPPRVPTCAAGKDLQVWKPKRSPPFLTRRWSASAFGLWAVPCPSTYVSLDISLSLSLPPVLTSKASPLLGACVRVACTVIISLLLHFFLLLSFSGWEWWCSAPLFEFFTGGSFLYLHHMDIHIRW